MYEYDINLMNQNPIIGRYASIRINNALNISMPLWKRKHTSLGKSYMLFYEGKDIEIS